MTWINTNKSKLYKLVAEYIHLPIMKHTSFVEAPDHSIYILCWSATNGTSYRACYSIRRGVPILAIQITDVQNTSYKEMLVHELSIKHLEHRGMTKKVQRESKARRLLVREQMFFTSA